MKPYGRDMRSRAILAEVGDRLHVAKDALREIATLEWAMANGVEPNDMPVELANGRVQALREWRQGFLFSYGLSLRIDRPVRFAQVEQADYDGVVAVGDGETLCLSTIQLKSVMPEGLPGSKSLQAQIDQVAQQYPDSPDLSVVIHVDTQIEGNLAELTVPKMKLGGLWLLYATNPKLTEWEIYGDLLESTASYPTRFAYPPGD